MELLCKWGNYEQLVREIKSFFSGMAKITGTLWEYNETIDNSMNHGLSSYLAVLLLECTADGKYTSAGIGTNLAFPLWGRGDRLRRMRCFYVKKVRQHWRSLFFYLIIHLYVCCRLCFRQLFYIQLKKNRTTDHKNKPDVVIPRKRQFFAVHQS